jgi:hypothetical protein
LFAFLFSSGGAAAMKAKWWRCSEAKAVAVIAGPGKTNPNRR